MILKLFRKLFHSSYHPVTIANYFIELANATPKSDKEVNIINTMKLNYLVYTAHGWYLAFYNKSLINCPVEIGQYGPLIDKIYCVFSKYRMAHIYTPIANYKTKNILTEDKEFLRMIFDTYAPYTGMQLSTLTHYDGTPWTANKHMWSKHDMFDVHYISNEVIRNFYLAKQGTEDGGKGL